MYDIEQIYSVLMARQYFKTLFGDIIGNSTIPSSGDFNVCCPLHKDPSPSFSINVDRPVFNCFGCGKKGDWINYLMLRNGWDFIKAVEFLAQEAGISKSSAKIAQPKKKANTESMPALKEHKEIDEEKFFDDHLYWAWCHDNLIENKQAQEFIYELRGIDFETVKACGIGIDTIKRNWVFPIRSVEQCWTTPMGEKVPALLGFEYRKHDFSSFTLNGKECKCIKTKGSPSALTAINDRTPEMRDVVILEGFIDAYLYVQHLREQNINKVWVLSPSCGLSRLTEQLEIFDFSEFESVGILLDNDYNHINDQGEFENIGFNKMEEIKTLYGNKFEYICLPHGINDFNEYYLKELKKGQTND